MPKKGKYVQFKNYERKMKSPFMIYVDFESSLVQEKMKYKIQKSFMRMNIKNILLVVMAMNQCVLMISLVNLLRDTQAKIQFTISLII